METRITRSFKEQVGHYMWRCCTLHQPAEMWNIAFFIQEYNDACSRDSMPNLSVYPDLLTERFDSWNYSLEDVAKLKHDADLKALYECEY
jgi:hypothetical protein